MNEKKVQRRTEVSRYQWVVAPAKVILDVCIDENCFIVYKKFTILNSNSANSSGKLVNLDTGKILHA